MAGKPDKLDQILAQLKSLDSKVDSVNSKLEALNTTVTNLGKEVASNTADIKELRADFEKYKTDSEAELKKLKTSFNHREQQLRSTTVRIFNLPPIFGESVDNYKGLASRVYDCLIRPALVAAKAAGDLATVPQQQNSIEACFRAYVPVEPAAGSPPAPVICRLSSRFIKFAVMKNRKAATALSEPEKVAGARRLAIVEDLTPPVHGLLKELQADRRVDKAWTVNGQVHYSLVGKSGFKKVKNIFDPINTFLPTE